MPRVRFQAPRASIEWMTTVSSALPSSIEASTTCPRPEETRSCSAASTPKASIMPPPAKSARYIGGTTGPVSGRPIVSSTPETAM